MHITIAIKYRLYLNSWVTHKHNIVSVIIDNKISDKYFTKKCPMKSFLVTNDNNDLKLLSCIIFRQFG